VRKVAPLRAKRSSTQPSVRSALGCGLLLLRHVPAVVEERSGDAAARRGLASAGAVQTSYGYDPYGVAQVTGTASDNPFQYPAARTTAAACCTTATDTTIQPGRASSPKIRSGSAEATSISIGYVANNPVQAAIRAENCPACVVLVAASAYAACRAGGGCLWAVGATIASVAIAVQRVSGPVLGQC